MLASPGGTLKPWRQNSEYEDHASIVEVAVRNTLVMDRNPAQDPDNPAPN